MTNFLRKFFFSDIYSIALVSLILFHLLENFIWIFLDTAPLPWDQAGHTRIALQFANYFKDLGFLRIVDYFSISSYYPPLIHTIASIPVLIFGNPVDLGQITITVFFLISIALVYVLANDLFGRKDLATTSAFLYSFLPFVFELSRWFLLEIPLLVFILAAIICLLRSEGFSNSRYTLGFFIFASLGFLTKWLAFFYLLFPTLIVLWGFIKKNSQEKIQAKDSLLKGFSIFLLVLLPWYLINIGTLIPDILINVQGEKVDPGILSAQNFLFYAYLFINFQLTFFISILFFTSLIFFLVNKYPQRKILLGYILFVYLVFTFVSNKDLRYILPIAPFAAILMSAFLMKLKDRFRNLGRITLFFLMLYLLSYYFLLSFRFPLDIEYQRAIKLPIIGWIDYVNVRDILAHRYNRSLWPQKEILHDIKNLEPHNNTFESIWVVTISDQERFNNANFVLEKEISGFDSIRIEPPPQKPSMMDAEVKSYLLRFRYAVIADKNVINPATRNVEVLLKFKEEVEKNYYLKIEEYNLPNGDLLTLYQLRP